MQNQEPQYQELEYLRNELNQRMNFSGEHTHKVLSHIMLMWGGTLAFFSVTENFLENKFLLFITATIFFISIVVLYLLSFVEFDCAKGNSVIAAYISVFYEKRPTDKKDEKKIWELALFEIGKKKKNESGGKRCKDWDVNVNVEYLWLSAIAIIIIIVVLVKVCFLSTCFNRYYICLGRVNIFVIGCFLYIIASIYFFIQIYKNTSLNPKRLRDLRQGHLKSFLEYAMENEYHDVDYVIKNFGEELCKDVLGELAMKLLKKKSSANVVGSSNVVQTNDSQPKDAPLRGSD